MSVCALTLEERMAYLAEEDPVALKRLFDAAYVRKIALCGKKVALRGLIEAGNVCAKDCYYCGIRHSNTHVTRYTLSADDIVRLAEIAAASQYGSLVIQTGEIESTAHTQFITEVLKRLAPLKLGITLSLGEQHEDVYRRWREAGAARYLLRIETSNPDLYARLHPAGHNWQRRVDCLRALHRCGYQVGTGVMCGLPGQTLHDLARDIAFFAEVDADMIGMGPYIPHPDTPLAHGKTDYTPEEKHHALVMGLKMIAVTRLSLPDLNIAASTALQALAPDGRAQGIRAGANVIMPNVTDTCYRRGYQLYAGKPTLDENAHSARQHLEAELASIGESPNYGQRGDSVHYTARLLPHL